MSSARPRRRQRAHLLGIALAGDRRRRLRNPDADVLKRLGVVGIARIDRIVEVRLLDAADRVDDANQRIGIWVGSGLMSTLLTTVKIDVVAPMPSASVTIAAAAKPGCLRSVRAV